MVGLWFDGGCDRELVTVGKKVVEDSVRGKEKERRTSSFTS